MEWEKKEAVNRIYNQMKDNVQLQAQPIMLNTLDFRRQCHCGCDCGFDCEIHDS